VKNRKKIFISTSTFSKYSPEPLTLLKRAGYQAILNPYGRRLTPDEVIQGLNGAVGLIAATEPLNDRVFAAAPFLRVISRVGTGLDSVDLAAAKQRGIGVFRTADAPIEAVAELALGLMLSVLRKVTAADRNFRASGWKSLMGHLLHQKRLDSWDWGASDGVSWNSSVLFTFMFWPRKHGPTGLL
jgi:D-3-phosphoglycerate dehydrogenase